MIEFFTLEPQQHRPHADGPQQQHSKSRHMATRTFSRQVQLGVYRSEFSESLSLFIQTPLTASRLCDDNAHASHALSRALSMTSSPRFGNFELSVSVLLFPVSFCSCARVVCVQLVISSVDTIWAVSIGQVLSNRSSLLFN